MAKKKLCVDCLWHSEWSRDGLNRHYCSHPELVSLVTGRVEVGECVSMRVKDGACGPEGRLWELQR